MSNPVFSRRSVLASLAGTAALSALPRTALAFSTAQAKALITKTVDEIMAIINSGKSETVMLNDFARVFSKYADTGTIAQLVLGVEWRSASNAQRAAFEKAFTGYITRKYGRRFRELIGGRVEVIDAKAVKSFYEISTLTYQAGQAPFDVVYVVADSSGLFIDMKVEGISLVKSERSLVGEMLDRRGGDLNALVAHLNTL